MRHLLTAAHTGHRRDRDVQRGRGLIDSANQQRVGREFGEHTEAVLQSSLNRSGEADRVTQVVDPVVDVAVRLLPGVEQCRRVVGHLGCQRGDVVEHPGELIEDGLDLRGVRGDIDGHLAGHDLALLPVGDDPADGLGGTADHRRGRGGDDGDHDVLDALALEFLADLLRGQFDGGHRTAAGDLQAQQRTAADDLHTVFERERAGHDRGAHLAQRVPDHRTRGHSVGLHGRSHGDLHRKDGRLDLVDPGHGLRRQDRLGHREAGFRGDHRLELSDLRGEHRLGVHQLATHLGPLRALAGEHEYRPTVIVTGRRLEGLVAGGDAAQSVHQRLAGTGDDGGAHRAMAAAAREGECEVLECEIYTLPLDPLGQAPGGVPQFVRGGGGHREHKLLGRSGTGGGATGVRSLLQHDVNVGSGHAVRRDTRATRGDGLVDRPPGVLLWYEQAGLNRGEVLRQTVEVDVAGHHTVVYGEYRLHQSEHTRRRLRVAEVALDRRQRAPAVVAVHGGDAVVLDGVADRGSGAVTFDHADRGRIDTGVGQSSAEHGDLRVLGRGEDVVGAAVLVGGGTANDGEHPVPVALSVVETFEHDDPAALRADEAVGLDVERVAATGRRQHSLAGSRGVEALVEHQHHAAGERHVALAVVQTAAGLMHGDHARGAGRVRGQCRSEQPQRVGDPA